MRDIASRLAQHKDQARSSKRRSRWSKRVQEQQAGIRRARGVKRRRRRQVKDEPGKRRTQVGNARESKKRNGEENGGPEQRKRRIRENKE